MPYHIIGLGGTFDHFHAGHELFLRDTAKLAEELWVGITTPELQRSKVLAECIEPYAVREKAVRDFLTSLGVTFKLFPLDDPYGPTLQGSPVEAISATEATQKGAEAINSERQRLGLPPLPVHLSNLLHDGDGDVLSSTTIRMGKVSRAGKVWWPKTTAAFHLTEVQRKFFHQQHGVALSEPQKAKAPLTLVVGDVVLEKFLRAKWLFDLGIYDGHSQRTVYVSPDIAALPIKAEIANPAGSISAAFKQFWLEFSQPLTKGTLSNSPSILKVNGEEDLLTVGAVLLAPLHTQIYYGHHELGMLCITVDEEIKQEFSRALQ